jgi:hypothetical protein
MRLPRFMGLLRIVGIALLVMPVADSTAVVKQKKNDMGECSLIDNQEPGVYLAHDYAWDEPETMRMILRNNSSCSITLIITGKPIIVRPGGKISHSPLPDVEDGASVVLLYRVNSVEEPLSFIDYWPYEHTVSTITLNGGHSVKFLVRAEYLEQGRQIAVPFNYEGRGFIQSSVAERLVCFPRN